MNDYGVALLEKRKRKLVCLKDLPARQFEVGDQRFGAF